MPHTLLSPADYRRMPWKNGGGTTAEIACAPLDGEDGRFLWRVSVADVAAPGPFSLFAGYDRLIAVVEGAGMRLTVDGIPAERRPGEPALFFSGDAAAECALLDGPIRDFNLVIDRKRAAGRLDVTKAGHALAVPAADAAFVHAMNGVVRVRTAAGLIRVAAGWTLRLDGEDGTVEAEAGAWALVARVDIR